MSTVAAFLVQILEASVQALKALPDSDRRDALRPFARDPLIWRELLQLAAEQLPRQSVVPSNGIAVPAPSTPRRRLYYDTPGELVGDVKSFQIKVTQYPGRRFTTWVYGQERRRLDMGFVENILGLSVHRKLNGGNSETLARAIYRHLADRFNQGDTTVSFS